LYLGEAGKNKNYANEVIKEDISLGNSFCDQFLRELLYLEGARYCISGKCWKFVFGKGRGI
jgi:hypothetical protein